MEELESQNHDTVQKSAEEALEPDFHVGELTMKSYAPSGSRLLTDTQFKEWT